MGRQPGAVEKMVTFPDTYRGKRVWLTGHTGFKGAWLAEWLLHLGAEVHGFALPPTAQQPLFGQLGLAGRMHHVLGDVRDAAAVARTVRELQPDFVFHLAAQPLVRDSYALPAETHATNATGTLHVLEALRTVTKPCAAVLVTTDKCYGNSATGAAFTERDPLGGDDPYSASKACAEIIIESWRKSFFRGHPVRFASARAGNVIGGGDWAKDRIVPDCIRALQAGRPIPVRNPAAIRPWQHVLEPLGGYLLLGARLGSATDDALCSPFNFGPPSDAERSVAQLVDELLVHWPGRWTDASDPQAPPEAATLRLDITKAKNLLGWRPVWDFRETITRTVQGYRDLQGGSGIVRATICREQVTAYGRAWQRLG